MTLNNQSDYELDTNKKVKEKIPMPDNNQKIQKIKKKLDNFKNAKEWSDFISLLTDVDNALKKVENIPKDIEYLLTKRLNQSIHPALPAGVHNKALQTYELIISRLKLSDHLTLGLFSYGIYSKLSVRKNYFCVLEKLNDKPVKSCSYVLGVLPFLEEENGEFFEPASRLIASQNEEQALWKNFLQCPELRIPVINYFKTRPVTLSNILIKSIHKTLYDGESLTVRGTMDLLNKNVPLNDLIKYLNPSMSEFEYENITKIELEQPSQSQTMVSNTQTQNIASEKNITLENQVDFEKKRIIVRDELLHPYIVKLATQILMLYLKKEVTINKKVNCWLQNDRVLQRKILKRIIDQDLDLFYKLFQNLIVQEELNDQEIIDLLLYALFKTRKKSKGFDIVYSLLENSFFWKMLYVEFRRVINNYRIGHSIIYPDEQTNEGQENSDTKNSHKSKDPEKVNNNKYDHAIKGHSEIKDKNLHDKNEEHATSKISQVKETPIEELKHENVNISESSANHSAQLKKAISEEQKNTINAVLGEQLPEKLIQDQGKSQVDIQAIDTTETDNDSDKEAKKKGGVSDLATRDGSLYVSKCTGPSSEKLENLTPSGTYLFCSKHEGGQSILSNLPTDLHEFSRTDISDSSDTTPDTLLSLLYFLFSKARTDEDQSSNALNMLLIVCVNHTIFDKEMLNKCIRVLIQAIDMKKAHEYIKTAKMALGKVKGAKQGRTSDDRFSILEKSDEHSFEYLKREGGPSNRNIKNTDNEEIHTNTSHKITCGKQTTSNDHIHVTGSESSDHMVILINSEIVNKIDQMLDDHYIYGAPIKPMLIFPNTMPLDRQSLYSIVCHVNPFNIPFWHDFIIERDLHHNFFILQHILPRISGLKKILFKRLFYQYDEKLFCAYELVYSQGFEEFMIEEIRELHIKQLYGHINSISQENENISHENTNISQENENMSQENTNSGRHRESHHFVKNSAIRTKTPGSGQFTHPDDPDIDGPLDNIITDRHLICLKILDYSFNVLNSIRFYRTLSILSNNPIHQFLSTLRSTYLFDHLLDICDIFLIEKLIKYNHRFIRHIRKGNRIIQDLLPLLRDKAEQPEILEYISGHSSQSKHPKDSDIKHPGHSRGYSINRGSLNEKGDVKKRGNRENKKTRNTSIGEFSKKQSEYKVKLSHHRGVYNNPLTQMDYNRIINIFKALLSLNLVPSFYYQFLYRNATLSFLYDTIDLIEHILQDSSSHLFFQQSLPLNNIIFRIKNREFNKKMYLEVISKYMETINNYKGREQRSIDQTRSEYLSENTHDNPPINADHLEQSVAHLILSTDTSRIDLFLLLETLKRIFKRRAEFNMETVVERSVCICSQVYEQRENHNKLITETVIYEDNSSSSSADGKNVRDKNTINYGQNKNNDYQQKIIDDSPFLYPHDINSVLVQIFDILLQDPLFITFYMKYFNMRLFLNERINRKIFLQILQKGKYGYINRAFNQCSIDSGNMPQLGISNTHETNKSPSAQGPAHHFHEKEKYIKHASGDGTETETVTSEIKIALNNIFYVTPAIHSRKYFNHFFKERIVNMRKIETISQLYFLMGNMSKNYYSQRLIEMCLTFLYKLLQNRKRVGTNIINMCLYNCGIELMDKIKGNILGICLFILRKEVDLLVDIENRRNISSQITDRFLLLWNSPDIDLGCSDTGDNNMGSNSLDNLSRTETDKNTMDRTRTRSNRKTDKHQLVNKDIDKHLYDKRKDCKNCCTLRAVVLDAFLFHHIGFKEFFEWYNESSVLEGTSICVLSRMSGVLRECPVERVFDLIGKLAMSGGIFSNAETLSQNNVEVLKKISFFIYSSEIGAFNTYITLIVPWINDLIVTSKSVRKEVFNLISVIFLRCDHNNLFSLFPIYSAELGNNTFLEVLRSMEILMLMSSKESVELRWQMSEGDSIFKNKLNEIYPGSITRAYKNDLPKKRELLLREDKREFLVRVESYYEQLDREIWEIDRKKVNKVILEWFRSD